MPRHFLCVLLLCVCLCSPARGEEPVKIGFMAILSGRVAMVGNIARQGMELAVNEINRERGINGRPVELVIADSRTDPGVAVREAERMIIEDKVDVIVGLVSSECALAVSKTAEKYKTPLIVTVALGEGVTGKQCNPWTFRITWHLAACARAAALIASESSARRWTTVGLKSRMGRGTWEFFKSSLGSLKPDAEAVDDDDAVFIAPNEGDFDAVVNKLKRSQTDGLLVSLPGGPLIDFVKKASAEGLYDGTRVIIHTAPSLGVLIALEERMPEDAWLLTPYWYGAVDSEINRAFVQAYESKYGAPPSYHAQFSYAGAKIYSEAVKRARSTDKKEIRAALEDLTMELPVGMLTIRAEDHQGLFHAVAGKTSSYSGRTSRLRKYRKLEAIKRLPPEKVFPSPEEMGCRMQ